MEQKCPVCDSKLNVGKTNEKDLFYVMCSSGGCNLGWQNGEAQWASYLVAIKYNVLKEYKYPNPRVRCKQHDELAVIVPSTSSNPILKGRLIYTCGITKEKGKKCDFTKSAKYPPNSQNAKNLEAWFKLDATNRAKDNKAAKAGLVYHLQEDKINNENHKIYLMLIRIVFSFFKCGNVRFSERNKRMRF